MALGRKAAGAVLAVCATWLAGCGEGLGECDTTMLGGDPFNGLPYEGQQIVAQKCSSGRCHSEGAMGDARVGAPGGLNFDVVGSDDVAVSRNIARVVDWAEDMWAEIEGGSMPPDAPAGTGELSSAEKEKVRNWLACGAPKIVSSATSATWDGIWPSLMGNCLGCHGGTAAAGGGFMLGEDACSSYNNIFMVPSLNPACGLRITASNPNTSLLYQKITGTQDPIACGQPMPPTGMLSQLDAPLTARIQQWIADGAPKPVGCP